MLDTLNSYIDDAGGSELAQPFWLQVAGDKRFTKLFVASVIAHVIFYAVIIKLDSWAMSRIRKNQGQPAPLVQIAELAPPPDRFKLRPPPEALERADLTRLQYDPNTTDDTRLLSRSPRPAEQRGSGGTLPTPEALEQHLRTSHGDPNATGSDPKVRQPAPPPTATVQTGRINQPDAPVLSPAPLAQSTPVPPPPSQRGNPAGGSSGAPEPPTPGTRRGDSSESVAFGLQQEQGRYEAAVRAKIRKVNEANMPRDWVRDVLRDKVSASFDLLIRRGGRIASLDLRRGSGYRVLDEAARQAIFIASPFEGYPQNAGDSILLSVTVYFFPVE